MDIDRDPVEFWDAEQSDGRVQRGDETFAMTVERDPYRENSALCGRGRGSQRSSIYLLKPRPIVPPPVAPAGSTTLSPVALPPDRAPHPRPALLRCCPR